MGRSVRDVSSAQDYDTSFADGQSSVGRHGWLNGDSICRQIY
jgi:hypothetical protein